MYTVNYIFEFVKCQRPSSCVSDFEREEEARRGVALWHWHPAAPREGGPTRGTAFHQPPPNACVNLCVHDFI